MKFQFFILLLHAMMMNSLQIRLSRRLQVRMQKDAMQDPFESSWEKAQIPISPLKVRLSAISKGGLETRGLIANIAFQEKDMVMRINPSDCIIVRDSGENDCTITGLDKNIWSKLSGNSRLSLLLLKKWIEISSSGTFTQAYMISLPTPEELPTPIHWDQNLLQELPYDHLKK